MRGCHHGTCISSMALPFAFANNRQLKVRASGNYVIQSHFPLAGVPYKLRVHEFLVKMVVQADIAPRHAKGSIRRAGKDKHYHLDPGAAQFPHCHEELHS